MTYDIINTGSDGNAVVINGEILIDCGIPMKKLRESGYIKVLKLVLLTHAHGDHFNAATVRALHQERPALRWGCCEWMVPHLLNAGVDKRVIDIFEPGLIKAYDGGRLYIKAESLVHDVPNCGWKIHIYDPICSSGDSLFYATDTSTLDGVSACCYDTYLIEANHTRAEIEARIAEKQARGEFAYETRAAQNHLSQEQAMEWLARNAGPNSRYVFCINIKRLTMDWKPLDIASADDRKAVALALYLSGYEVRQSKRKDGNKTVVFVEYRERTLRDA